MKLLHNKEQLTLDNNKAAITTIFEKINESIIQKDTVFSHLVIDGVEVYENHEEYIKSHIHEITSIEIATKTSKAMIWETMVSIHEYLERAIPALKALVDESFERFTNKSWEGINQLAEGMQWILQFSSFTRNSTYLPSEWDGIEKRIRACEDSFAQLLSAVEVTDTVLITDILSYEVTPAYESLIEVIALSLKDKEYLDNVN